MIGPRPALPPNPHYTLPNDWEFADERPALLGAAYDPPSIALAQRLGVRAGSTSPQTSFLSASSTSSTRD
jgi:hypothetical protein